jgi:hypothetical protein
MEKWPRSSREPGARPCRACRRWASTSLTLLEKGRDKRITIWNSSHNSIVPQYYLVVSFRMPGDEDRDARSWKRAPPRGLNRPSVVFEPCHVI